MAQIGYEKNIDLLQLFDRAEMDFNQGAMSTPIQLGLTMQDSIKQAEADCLRAIGVSKSDVEKKTTTQGHPWQGKRIVWTSQTRRLIKRDGGLIMQIVHNYEVQP